MAGKVISTVESEETLTDGKDKNMELTTNKKQEDNPTKDFPMTEIDQSKVVSTRNVVPNKRSITLRDIHKFLKKTGKKILKPKDTEPKTKEKKSTKKVKGDTEKKGE